MLRLELGTNKKNTHTHKEKKKKKKIEDQKINYSFRLVALWSIFAIRRTASATALELWAMIPQFVQDFSPARFLGWSPCSCSLTHLSFSALGVVGWLALSA